MINFDADPSNTSEFGEIVEISSKLGHSWRHFTPRDAQTSIIITTNAPMATYGGDTVTLELASQTTLEKRRELSYFELRTHDYLPPNPLLNRWYYP
jgi:hypothetical protein